MLSVETVDSTTEDDSNVAVRGTVPIGEMTQAMAESRIEAREQKDNNGDKHREQANRVRCVCKDPNSDLGMIQCDRCRCRCWEHIVCAGFYSDADKRLESVQSRVCFACLFGEHPEASAQHRFIRDLCRMRRALSVMYGEGITTLTDFANRLGICNLIVSRCQAPLSDLQATCPGGLSRGPRFLEEGLCQGAVPGVQVARRQGPHQGIL